MAWASRPAFHRLGPLLGQVVLGQSLQRADQLAVDDPGRQRVEVARGRRDPGLVEQCQAPVDLAVEDRAGAPRRPGRWPRRRRRMWSRPRSLDVPTAVRRRGRRSASARSCARRRTRHARASHRRRRGAARLGPATLAPVPSARCRTAGASPPAPRRPPRRWSRRRRISLRVGPLPGLDGHVEVPRAVGDVGEHRQIGHARADRPRRPPRNRSNATCQSPREAASWARPTGCRLRRRSSHLHSTAVTAVTVLLTPLG